jgi:hypothetical protein
MPSGDLPIDVGDQLALGKRTAESLAAGGLVEPRFHVRLDAGVAPIIAGERGWHDLLCNEGRREPRREGA